MSIDVFNYLDLCIKLAGLVVLVFGGGRYFGTITQVLKQMNATLTEHKDQFDKHLDADAKTFEKLNNGINEIKVQIASIK